jgi:hypothetical protein
MGMGGRGAALATLLAAGVMGLLYRVIAFRVTGTRLNPSLLKCILASVVMYAGMLGMSRLLGRTIWADIGTSLAGSSLYVLSLMALQERLREDCSYLLSVFSPWRMGLYIRGELRPVPMPEEEKA